MCLRWSTTDEIDHSVTGGYSLRDNRTITVGEWFGLVPLSTIHGIVVVFKSKPMA